MAAAMGDPRVLLESPLKDFANANGEALTDVKLNGENSSFNLGMTIEGVCLTGHESTGQACGKRVEGTAQVGLSECLLNELPYRASRNAASAYFTPTDVNMP